MPSSCRLSTTGAVKDGSVLLAPLLLLLLLLLMRTHLRCARREMRGATAPPLCHRICAMDSTI